MHIKITKLIGCWALSFLPIGFAASLDVHGLAEAVRNRDKDSVQSLLKQHSDVNVTLDDGSTALQWAVHWDDLDTADLLIRANANVNASNDLGVTPLYLACANGNAAMVQKLLAAGANPNLAAVTGVSPLMMAARTGSVSAVQALVAHGANPNAKENARGQTALMWAASQKQAEVVRVLVEHGAEVDAHSNSIDLPVNIKSGNGYGEDVRGPSRVIEVGGSTPLRLAARQGCIECAKFLLAGGANINDAGPDGNTALVIAAHSGEGPFARFLLEKGANPNSDGAGYAALHAAVLRNDFELVKALLSHGANPNMRFRNGTGWRHNAPDFALPESLVGGTPFLLAAKYASVDMMRALTASGADIKLAANNGTTPLIAAAGPDHRTGGNGGDAPIDNEGRSLEAVKVLLDLGSDINAPNQDGNTALHVAAARGSSMIVHLLADRGAQLDVKNKSGKTPVALTLAVLRRFSDLEGQDKLRQAAVIDKFKNTADFLQKAGAAE